MSKYKRYERSFVKSLSDERRIVRHSRTPFRGDRGVRCEECGDTLSPLHVFAVYGCFCVRCWNGLVEVREEWCYSTVRSSEVAENGLFV